MPEAPVADLKTDSADNIFTVDKADQVLRTAEYLINPLRQQQGTYDAVSVSGYQIKQSEQHLTVSRGDELILVARNGEVISDQVTDQDWATLSQIQIPERFPQPAMEIDNPAALLQPDLGSDRLLPNSLISTRQ